MLGLALRNILRHKVRTGMTLGAIMAGVVGLIVAGGFVADILFQLSESTIHSQSGHLQVSRSGYFDRGSRSPEKFLMERPEDVSRALDGIPGILDSMGRLSFSGLLSNGRSDLSIVGEGVEAAKEARLGSFLDIVAGRQLNAADRYGVLVGYGVANSLNLRPGDRVTVLLNTVHGAMNSLDLDVVGVFRTFSKEFDARAVRIPLAAAQELFGSEGVNSIVVALHRTEDTDATVAALAGRLDQRAYEVKTWRQLNDFYQKAVDLYDRQFGVLRLIVLLMVLLTVANTVNMSVFERVGEFGTLKALGNRDRDVFRLVLTENALIGSAGAILGVAAGIAVAYGISAAGIEMPPPPNANTGYPMTIRLAPQAVLTSAVIGLVAAILASIPPALRVARRPIAESLRQNQ